MIRVFEQIQYLNPNEHESLVEAKTLQHPDSTAIMPFILEYPKGQFIVGILLFIAVRQSKLVRITLNMLISRILLVKWLLLNYPSQSSMRSNSRSGSATAIRSSMTRLVPGNPRAPYQWPNGQGNVVKFLAGRENSSRWGQKYVALYQTWSSIIPETWVSSVVQHGFPDDPAKCLDAAWAHSSCFPRLG